LIFLLEEKRKTRKSRRSRSREASDAKEKKRKRKKAEEVGAAKRRHFEGSEDAKHPMRKTKGRERL